MPETLDQPKTTQQTTGSASGGGASGNSTAQTVAASTEAPMTPEPSSDGYEDPMSALSALLTPKPQTPKDPTKKPEPQKEEPKKAVSDATEEAKKALEGEKGVQTPPTGQKPQEGASVGQTAPVTAKDLRAALDNTKKENQTLRAELDKLRRVKPEDPEKKVVMDKLSEKDKRLQEYENEIKLAKFEKSQEYKEKYLQPLEKAIASAHEEILYFPVLNDDGSQRQATPQDFNAILSIENPASALMKAKEMFGDYAMEVIGHRRKIWDLHKGQKEAIETYRKQAEERDKNLQLEQMQAQEKAQGIWEETIRLQQEKFPQWFSPEDGDEEGNSVLEKGIQIADLVFSGSKGVPFEKKVQLEATVRNKAAAFDRLAMKNQKLSDRVKELESELASVKSSAPQESQGEGEKVEDDSWQSELDKALSPRR